MFRLLGKILLVFAGMMKPRLESLFAQSRPMEEGVREARGEEVNGKGGKECHNNLSIYLTTRSSQVLQIQIEWKFIGTDIQDPAERRWGLETQQVGKASGCCSAGFLRGSALEPG